MSTHDGPPIHPGVTLYEGVTLEFDLSANQMAQPPGVPAYRSSEIVRGRRAVTADTALRLAEWLGTSAEFRMRLRKAYELRLVIATSGAAIERTVRPLPSAA